MRYLGAYPTEEELVSDILPALSDDEESGVRFDRFEALMLRVLLDKLYEPDSEETILQAFKVRHMATLLTARQRTKHATTVQQITEPPASPCVACCCSGARPRESRLHRRADDA